MNDPRLKPHVKAVTATAPATLTNLGAGFDLLGMALTEPKDIITLHKRSDTALNIKLKHNNTDIPLDPTTNTASVAIAAMLEDLQLRIGFDIIINKGIDLESGLGGSAASAAAAITACNAFLEQPLHLDQLLAHAAVAEKTISNSICDNAAAALWGGCVLVGVNNHIIPLPAVPGTILITKPILNINTKRSRQLLPADVPVATAIKQSCHLASFISALYTNNIELAAMNMIDLFAEPARQPLYPFYMPIKEIARQAGALATCISGSGPAMMTLIKDDAPTIQAEIKKYCDTQSWDYKQWISTGHAAGATVLEVK